MRREAETLGEALRIRRKISREQIETISGVDTAKCMKCGKCTASCPVGEEMDIKPHQFVSYVNRGEIEPLQKAALSGNVFPVSRACSDVPEM